MALVKRRELFVFLTFAVTGLTIGFMFGQISSKVTKAIPNCRSFTVRDTSVTSGFMPSAASTKESGSDMKLLFVGLMTTKENLGTKALAASETWIPHIQGDVSFFCGMTCNNSLTNSSHIKLTLLPLAAKEDGYPPQKKSFMMLKYMYENHLNDYEWFFRGDDDVYIKGEKLTTFLTTLNSKKAFFIGHPATGRVHEKGKLGLIDNKPYCMGGPGIILSRKTLELLGPHLDHCMNNLYSSHEDSEIGRCVQRFVRISCVGDKLMETLFHNMYDWKNQVIDPSKYSGEIRYAITLHPLKNHHSIYALHKFIEKERKRARN